MGHAPIEIGFQVFARDGEEEFGAVREILAGGLLVVDIENKGDVLIPSSAVSGVIEQKVLIDLDALDEKVRSAIGHAHDAETL